MVENVNRIVIPTFLLLLLGSVFFVPRVHAITPDSWTTKLSMPTARKYLGIVALNGKIYAIGGYKEGSGILQTNEVYDPTTDLWTDGAPMPTARWCFAICCWQEKIFAIGGRLSMEDSVSSYTGTVEVYDPLSDSWETNRTSMPTPRGFLCANVVNDKIYLIGGGVYFYAYQNTFDTNEVYDPSEDSWTTKAPIPTPTSGYVSGVVDDKIYIMGGQSDLNQVYDPSTNTWDFKAKPPYPYYGGAAGVTSGLMAPRRIIVVMGIRTDIYNPESNLWTTGTPMPTARAGLGAAVVDDLFYAIGGQNGGITTKNEQYTPFGYIPEFPSFPILILFMIATSLTLMAYRRKRGLTLNGG